MNNKFVYKDIDTGNTVITYCCTDKKLPCCEQTADKKLREMNKNKYECTETIYCKG